jgi:hypothetical protein
VPLDEAGDEDEGPKEDVKLEWTSFRNFYESASAVNLIV